MAKEIVFTEKAPKAVGPYVQAVKKDGMVYCSGQLGIDVETGGLAEGVEAQAHCSLKNLGAVLEAAGSSYQKVNKIYESCFGGDYPARSCVQVAKLPLGGLVEIECIAEV